MTKPPKLWNLSVGLGREVSATSNPWYGLMASSLPPDLFFWRKYAILLLADSHWFGVEAILTGTSWRIQMIGANTMQEYRAKILMSHLLPPNTGEHVYIRVPSLIFRTYVAGFCFH